MELFEVQLGSGPARHGRHRPVAAFHLFRRQVRQHGFAGRRDVGGEDDADAQPKPQRVRRGFDAVLMMDRRPDERRKVDGFPDPLEEALQIGPGANP